jgi:hypothetical protein
LRVLERCWIIVCGGRCNYGNKIIPSPLEAAKDNPT